MDFWSRSKNTLTELHSFSSGGVANVYSCRSTAFDINSINNRSLPVQPARKTTVEAFW